MRASRQVVVIISTNKYDCCRIATTGADVIKNIQIMIFIIPIDWIGNTVLKDETMDWYKENLNKNIDFKILFTLSYCLVVPPRVSPVTVYFGDGFTSRRPVLYLKALIKLNSCRPHTNMIHRHSKGNFNTSEDNLGRGA